jgi:hypothetical protein
MDVLFIGDETQEQLSDAHTTHTHTHTHTHTSVCRQRVIKYMHPAHESQSLADDRSSDHCLADLKSEPP